MKRPIFVAVAVGCAGVAMAVTSAGLGVADVPTAEDHKRAAVAAGGIPLTDEQMAEVLAQSAPSVVVTGQEESGPATEVLAIKTALPGMLHRLLNLQDLPQTPDQRMAALPAALDNVRASVPQLFAASVVSKQTTDLINGVTVRATTPQMEMMQAAKLGAPEWNLVRVLGAQAQVVITVATSRLTVAQGWIDEGRSQFEISLVKANDGSWLISSMESQNLDGQG